MEERIGGEVAKVDGVANSIRCCRSPTAVLVLLEMGVANKGDYSCTTRGLRWSLRTLE